MVASLNITVIYCAITVIYPGIFTLENVGIEVNYGDIFKTLAPSGKISSFFSILFIFLLLKIRHQLQLRISIFQHRCQLCHGVPQAWSPSLLETPKFKINQNIIINPGLILKGISWVSTSFDLEKLN
jgi:hypothetical protein